MLIVLLLSELSNHCILIFVFKTGQFCPCKHNLVLLPQLKSQLAQSLQSEVFSLPLKSRLGFVLVFGFFFAPSAENFWGFVRLYTFTDSLVSADFLCLLILNSCVWFTFGILATKRHSLRATDASNSHSKGIE